METTATRTTRSWRPFLRHLGEMLLAMFAGMVVLGGAAEGIFALAGSSLGDSSPAIRAWIMAVAMTVPMVWWMQRRGHEPARSAEMAGAMIVPTFLTVDLYWAGVLAGEAVLAVQHAVMIPAMVAAMLWRREHYSGHHH